MKDKTRNQISWHLKDLLRKDVRVSLDCIHWLEPSQRDTDRRAMPKRLMARYHAAMLLVNAPKHGGNAGLQSLILDRTEGKVADKLITLDLNAMVRQLEAARQRVIDGAKQDLLPQQVVVADYELVSNQEHDEQVQLNEQDA